MGDLVLFPGATRLDLPPDRVLSAAIGCLESVIVIGTDRHGELYAATSMGDLRRAHFQLLKAARLIEEEEGI